MVRPGSAGSRNASNDSVLIHAYSGAVDAWSETTPLRAPTYSPEFTLGAYSLIGEIIARLKDADGRCLVPGFYDDVLELDPEERAAFASLNYTDAILREETGAPAPFGDADLAKAGSRATNTVTITDSKFTGQGTGYGLAASMGAFPSPDAFAREMEEAGLAEIRYRRLPPAPRGRVAGWS